MTTTIILIIGLLVLSAFFSASELALFSLSHTNVRTMRDKGKKSAVLIEHLKENPHRLLTTILIGNNIVNIFSASLATKAAIDIFGSRGLGIATGAMTLLVLMFGEIIPKSFSANNAPLIASLVARPIYILEFVLWPIVVIFDFLGNLISPRGRKKKKISEDEIRMAARLGYEEGVVEKDEREMIEKVFRLNDTLVKNIMTKWEDVIALPADTTIKDALVLLRESGFSRVPVYQQKKSKVMGVLYLKDLLPVLDSKPDDPIALVMQSPPECAPNDMVDDLLKQFKRRKQHLAIVRDSHEHVVGIVTLEDVLEELVGEIHDETDTMG